MAQSRLARQRRRLWLLVPAGAIGGIIGGILLLNSTERLFTELVPFLILLASGLLAVQSRCAPGCYAGLRRVGLCISPNLGSVPVGLAAIYGVILAPG